MKALTNRPPWMILCYLGEWFECNRETGELRELLQADARSNDGLVKKEPGVTPMNTT